MKSKMNKSSLKSLLVILSGLVVVCVALVFFSGIASLAQAGSPAQSVQEGQAIFQQKCAACHTIGGGKLVGPDLQGVTQRRDLAWIKKFIASPDQVLSSGDPLAQQLLAESNNVAMPNLGITPAETDALVAYLESPGVTAGQPPAPALPAGEALQGEKLFNGAASLANGGISCIACHSVAGSAALGGGTLGPDLTQVFTRYGAAGLQGALSTLPFPTMQSGFANRPLTAQEQADLYAYFEKANQAASPTPPMTTWFLVIGAIGALALFAMMLIFWPRQRQSLSDALRQKA